MKLRCLPPNRQKGFSALTMPAPFVQRLPAPPANETTATIPAASASLPISWYFGSDAIGGVKEIFGANVGNAAADGKAILRQPHAAAAQVRLDLLMLHAIKSMSFQERVEALRAVGFLRALRDEVLEDVLHHPLKLRHGVAGGGEAFQFHAAHGRKQARFHAQKRRDGHLVVARRHQRRVAFEQHGLSAMFVDGEIVDHGFHGEGHGMFHLPLGVAHDGLQALLGPRFAMGSKEKSHAAARHSTEHPEAPEVVAHFPAHAANQRVRVEISGPGNNGLNGAVEIPLRAGAQAANVAALQAAQ